MSIPAFGLQINDIKAIVNAIGRCVAENKVFWQMETVGNLILGYLHCQMMVHLDGKEYFAWYEVRYLITYSIKTVTKFIKFIFLHLHAKHMSGKG